MRKLITLLGTLVMLFLLATTAFAGDQIPEIVAAGYRRTAVVMGMGSGDYEIRYTYNGDKCTGDPDGECTYEYDSNRNISRIVYDNGMIKTYQYDSSNRIAAITTTIEGTDSAEYTETMSYTYNDKSQVVKVTRAQGGMTFGWNFRYQEDGTAIVHMFIPGMPDISSDEFGYDAATFDAAGNMTSYKSYLPNEDGTIIEMSSYTYKYEKIPAASKSPFKDVAASKYYYKPVLWATANNVVYGTSNTTFEPNKGCTRAEIVAFLWRNAGCPAPKSTATTFTDISSKAYYYDAVLWATENKIVYGTSDTTFAPTKTCTRAETVAFLYRASGCPAPKSTTTAFTDIDPKAYYYNAVLWATENKIVYGTGDTTFAPTKTCSRAEVVAFLYRAKGCPEV